MKGNFSEKKTRKKKSKKNNTTNVLSDFYIKLRRIYTFEQQILKEKLILELIRGVWELFVFLKTKTPFDSLHIALVCVCVSSP